MTAMITAAVIGVGGSLIAGNKAKNAAKDAQGIAADSEQRALEENARQYDQTREDNAPLRDAQQNALMQMNDPNMYFMSSPGYQFRMDEGLRNTQNAFSMKGGGGNAMKAMNDYAQGMASFEYGDWYNRQLNRAGLGAQGVANTTQAGMNASNAAQNTMLRSGENQASIGLYGANQQASHMSDAWGGLLGGIKNYAGNQAPSSGTSSGYSPNYFMSQQTDNQMLGNYNWGNVDPSLW